MNWKVSLITIASVILYAYALVCFGLAGPNIQSIAIIVGGYILKYGADIVFEFSIKKMAHVFGNRKQLYPTIININQILL